LGAAELHRTYYLAALGSEAARSAESLIHSALNALASTANYFKNYGWVSGKPWTEGAPNFLVLQKWNESEVYAKTVAYFVTRLAKEPWRSLTCMPSTPWLVRFPAASPRFHL
jgi:hypothetical protein